MFSVFHYSKFQILFKTNMKVTKDEKELTMMI